MCVSFIVILSFCYIIPYNKMDLQDDIHMYILDDENDNENENENGNGCTDDINDKELLDTRWIIDMENDILMDEYRLFLKTDILCVSFQFIYLDQDKKVEFVLPPSLYTLIQPNQITQNELFQIIHPYQKRMEMKYYNFHSLLLYDFQFLDSRYELATYLRRDDDDDDNCGRIIEYTNLLSVDTIYFQPLIAMFHSLIGFTVILYED